MDNKKDSKQVNKDNELMIEEFLNEEEIEGYSGCTSRTQFCLTDCPWPFPGSYISSGD